MNVWKLMSRICGRTAFTKRWSLQLYYLYKTWLYQHRFSGPDQVNPHTVVFESFMGKKYACSPRAFYEEMLKNPRYKHWKKIWAFRDPESYQFLEENPDTKVVAYRSADYYKAYAQGKYWITNSRLPRELRPRNNQEYIQCWHGTPLKKLGFDLKHYSEKNSSLREVRDNYREEAKRMTRMPSPSPFYSEKMISAFDLKAQGKENILLEAGYPRNDRLLKADPEEREMIRKRFGIPEGKTVILYAPTWRENQHTPGAGYTYRLMADFFLWKETLQESYVVLFRAHYFISNQMDFSGLEGFVTDVSGEDEITDCYLASDLLITDYSSVFFDFANLNRPILFYMYDYQQYREEMRDFYFDSQELPGPVFTEEKDLLNGILNLTEISRAYQEKYKRFNKKFNPHRQPSAEIYLNAWLRDN